MRKTETDDDIIGDYKELGHQTNSETPISLMELEKKALQQPG